MPSSRAWIVATSKSSDLAKWAHRNRLQRITMVPMQVGKGQRQNNQIIVMEDSIKTITSAMI
jgi:hypothetical protein